MVRPASEPRSITWPILLSASHHIGGEAMPRPTGQAGVALDVDGHHRRVAQVRGGGDQRIEHGLQLELRPADGPQHLARRRLLLERFLQLARSRLYLLEQTRVLDGDHGLVGEGLHEFNLLCRERPHLAAPASDHADYDVLSEHWHGENRANPCCLWAYPCVLGILQHVMDVDNPALKHCPSRRRLAALRNRVLLCDLDELGRGAIDGRSAIDLAILPDDEPRVGARELHGALY